MAGLGSAYGWFESITIVNSPVFEHGATAKLGKMTLVVGDNATGKSALCEWIAGFADAGHVERWRRSSDPGWPIRVSLKYYDPEERTLDMEIGDTGRVKFFEDSRCLLPLAHPLNIIYPDREVHADAVHELNDLQFLSLALHVDESVILDLCDVVQTDRHSAIGNIRFREDDEGIVRLHADVTGTAPGLAFRCLSGGEQERVILELAIAAASYYAKHMPTLLIIDGSVARFMDVWFKLYTSRFYDPSSLFQTIAVIPSGMVDVGSLKWLGWEVVRTQGLCPRVTIEQNIR